MESYANSCSNSLSLTPNAAATQTTSQWGNAYEWNGVDTNLRATFVSSTPFNGSWTISGWINPDSLGEGAAYDWARVFDIGGKTYMRLETGTNGYNLKFTQVYSGSAGGWQTTSDAVVPNQCNYVAVVFDSSVAGNTPKMYINGVLQTVNMYATPSGTKDLQTLFNLGNNQNNGVRTFDGKMDEFMISSTELSTDWIETLYANQSNPATFFGN